MKNKILLGAMALAFSTLSMNVNAQLEVQTSGDVQISKNLTVTKHVAINGAANTDSVALRVSTPDVNEDIRSFGVYSTAIAPSLSIIRTGCSVGLVGQIISQNMLRNSLMPPFRRPFYAGVVGLAPTGVALYGATNSSLPIVWIGPSYAGYFDGDVNVTGDLYATTINIPSDPDMTDNMRGLNTLNSLGLLSQLTPLSYTLRPDSSIYHTLTDEPNTHYGFNAKEVQKILPELVQDNEGGKMSVNYLELIPLLVQAIQELSAEVETLKAQIK